MSKQLKEDALVKVTLEGYVVDFNDAGWLKIRSKSGSFIAFYRDDEYELQKLADPDPEWQLGHSIRDAEDDVWAYYLDNSSWAYEWVCVFTAPLAMGMRAH